MTTGHKSKANILVYEQPSKFLITYVGKTNVASVNIIADYSLYFVEKFLIYKQFLLSMHDNIYEIAIVFILNYR